MNPPRPLHRAVAMVATATAAVAANPTFDLWLLSFVALVPWLWATRGLSFWRAFGWGLLAGSVAVFCAFFWLDELLTRFGGVPRVGSIPIVGLFAAAQGLQFAIPAALARTLLDRTSLGAWIVAPLCWVTCEAGLPTIFPMYFAITWAWHPLWIQTAEIGGVTTVSFVILMLNGAIYDLVPDGSQRRRFCRPAAMALVVGLIGTPLFGAWRLAAVDAALSETRRVKVGVVQGNMSIEQMMTPGWPLKILRKHQDMSTQLELEGAELLVWGETAYPNVFDRSVATDRPLPHLWRVRRNFQAPLVFGLATVDRASGNPYLWNSAWVLQPDGGLGDRYDKVFLLMFGEYTPLVDPDWFREIFPTAAHLNRGAGPTTLTVNGLTLGPLICYEDILPRYARKVADEGIHAFVNLTNDAWFGQSTEPAQHLALAVFRTVEHRRSMVRAVTTGISAHIDPTGRILRRTALTDPEVDGPQPADGFVEAVAMVEPGDMTTLYARFGEWFNVAVGLSLLGVFVRLWTGR